MKYILTFFIFIIFSNYTFSQNAIDSSLLYYVPNSFSPNGDENNNILCPVITNLKENDDYLFQVYNRRGMIIFESKNPRFGWDGFFKGKLMPPGIYSWSLKLFTSEYPDGKQIIGHVLLML